MRIHVVPVLAVLLLTALFALINWPTFTASSPLSLGVATVDAPMGLVMLGVVVVLGLVALASVIAMQTSALIDSRRLNRELHAQRELADRAEASRFVELRDFVAAETFKLAQSSQQLRADVSSRIDQLEQRQRIALEQAGNSLAASIGELDDRLHHRDPSLRLAPDERDMRLR